MARNGSNVEQCWRIDWSLYVRAVSWIRMAYPAILLPLRTLIVYLVYPPNEPCHSEINRERCKLSFSLSIEISLSNDFADRIIQTNHSLD